MCTIKKLCILKLSFKNTKISAVHEGNSVVGTGVSSINFEYREFAAKSPSGTKHNSHSSF